MNRSTRPLDLEPATIRSDHASDQELMQRWVATRDPDARERLFTAYLPVARRLARRYHSAHESTEELVQVASIGLLGAIDRFDPERGAAFVSFAIPTILGELKRHFRNTGWSAHVPRGSQELALRVDRAVAEIGQSSGRAPGPAEVARYLEIDLADVLVGMDAGAAHFSRSMDAPVESEEPGTQSLHDMLGRDEGGYHLVDVKLSLAEALPKLPWRERTALRMRMDEDLKQSQIAERMGCSQMQVSRLLRSATERVRASMADG
jgi:RNA polymerase sigma-B factor